MIKLKLNILSKYNLSKNQTLSWEFTSLGYLYSAQ